MEGIRIGVLGNVDSAKTTTISVLKNNILDNGRGSARSLIFKHKHEQDTGRTSSINHTHVKHSEEKVISYVDLAGHEKYLKTTVFGLNACSIDYAVILVGANMGVLRMTKEHFKLAMALNLPIIFVITKIDICPENILAETIKNINKLIKLGYRKHQRESLIIESLNDLKYLEGYPKENKKYVPVFKISNTTGKNIDILKSFIGSLPKLFDFNQKKMIKNTLFTIEETFFVDGVGCVVSGVVKEGIIKIGDKLTIGPFNGSFKQVIVKSIHDNFRNSIDALSAGMSGCVCIKGNKKDQIKKKKIKKGMVLNNDLTKIDIKKTYREFLADVLILHHPTTIRENYQPVIHCGSISQSAKICKINTKNNDVNYVDDLEKPCLRTGDKSEIKFMFTNRPEFIQEGYKIMFREGKTKGIGRVTKVLD